MFVEVIVRRAVQMSAKKEGRKRKNAFKKFKKELKAIAALHRCISTAQKAVEIGLMASSISKCLKCEHTFKEQLGGIVAPNKMGEEKVLLKEEISEMIKDVRKGQRVK